jgi:hypothetical protein
MTMHRNVLEVTDAADWFKSSYSSDLGASCVEVADLVPTHNLVAVRDSKRPTGPALVLPTKAFTAFVESVKA